MRRQSRCSSAHASAWSSSPRRIRRRARTAGTGRTFGRVVAVVDPLRLVEQGERPSRSPSTSRSRAGTTRDRYGFCGSHMRSPSALAGRQVLARPRRGRRARAARRPVRRACRRCPAAAPARTPPGRGPLVGAPGASPSRPCVWQRSPRVMLQPRTSATKPTLPQPGDGLGVRRVGAGEVARRPGREPAQRTGRRPGPGRRPAAPGPAPPRVLDGAVQVALRAAPARPGTSRWPRGAPGRRRGRRPRSPGGGVGRPAAVVPAQRRSTVVEPSTDGGEVRHLGQRPGERHREHRPGPHHVVGQRAQPAGPLGLPPLPPQPGMASSIRSAAREGRRQPGRARSPRDGRPRRANHALARRCSSATCSGVPLAQVRAQHVGEQVVVAVPLASVVERDEEEVGPLEGDERRAAPSLCPVTASQSGPVEPRRGRTSRSRKSRTSGRLAGQHLLGEVVDDVPVVAREAGDERRRRPRGPASRAPPAAGRRSSPRCGRRAPRRRRRLSVEAHRVVEVGRRLLDGEAQVGGAHLDRARPGPAAGPAAAAGRRGWRAPGAARRQVLEQERQRLVHVAGLDEVVVVEHEHERFGGGRSRSLTARRRAPRRPTGSCCSAPAPTSAWPRGPR